MKKILVTIPVREKDRKFLEEKGKEFQFCYRTKEEITVSDVVDAEIILGNIPVELVPKAKKLKFLQLDSAGYKAGKCHRSLRAGNFRIYAGWSIDAAEKAASVSEKYGAASVEGRGRSAVNP